MALVADYGPSSGEEDLGDEDETPSQSQSGPLISHTSNSKSSITSTSTSVKLPPPKTTSAPFFEDSSEDEDDIGDLDDTAGLGKFLPKPKDIGDLSSSDQVEEIGPIPPKKLYGDEEVPKPPPTFFPNIMAKKVKGIVRIAAPSLKDFENDEDDKGTRKFTQQNKKSSGLFSILPEPKGMLSGPSGKPMSFLKNSNPPTPIEPSSSLSTITSTFMPSTSTSTSSSTKQSSVPMPRTLIPDSVKNLGKRPPPTKLDEIKAKYLKQEANVVIVSRSSSSTKDKPLPSAFKNKDSDDSDEESSDFFSFDSKADNIDPETLEKLKLPAPDFTQRPSSSTAIAEETIEDEFNEALPSTSMSRAQQEEIARYHKKKGKGKEGTDVNFIDINADDLRPDTTEWIKNITDESAIPVRRGKGLGGMQKRKHQITYLAVEAKAREQELQQQWAQNRQNRRQTQMKYGF